MQHKYLYKCYTFLYDIQESGVYHEWALCAFSAPESVECIMKEFYPDKLKEILNK